MHSQQSFSGQVLGTIFWGHFLGRGAGPTTVVGPVLWSRSWTDFRSHFGDRFWGRFCAVVGAGAVVLLPSRSDGAEAGSCPGGFGNVRTGFRVLTQRLRMLADSRTGCQSRQGWQGPLIAQAHSLLILRTFSVHEPVGPSFVLPQPCSKAFRCARRSTALCKLAYTHHHSIRVHSTHSFRERAFSFLVHQCAEVTAPGDSSLQALGVCGRGDESAERPLALWQ